jgi:hypothetical protein
MKTNKLCLTLFALFVAVLLGNLCTSLPPAYLLNKI